MSFTAIKVARCGAVHYGVRRNGWAVRSLALYSVIEWLEKLREPIRVSRSTLLP